MHTRRQTLDRLAPSRACPLKSLRSSGNASGLVSSTCFLRSRSARQLDFNTGQHVGFLVEDSRAARREGTSNGKELASGYLAHRGRVDSETQACQIADVRRQTAFRHSASIKFRTRCDWCCHHRAVCVCSGVSTTPFELMGRSREHGRALGWFFGLPPACRVSLNKPNTYGTGPRNHEEGL